MRVTYHRYDKDRNEWVKVKSLDQIPLDALPHVFALQHNEDFECQEPIEHVGIRFRAIWEPQDLKDLPNNPLMEEIARRIDRARTRECRVEELEARIRQFESAAEKMRDRIAYQLSLIVVSLAAVFNGNRQERHAKLGQALGQIPRVLALCKRIPELLNWSDTDAADDTSF